MNDGVPGAGSQTSRLPRDGAYWEDLALRSVERALEASEAAGGGQSAWWTPFAERSRSLAATAVAALLGAAFLVQGRSGPAAEPVMNVESNAAALAASLAPEDPLLRALFKQPEEPTAEVWILLASLRSDLQ